MRQFPRLWLLLVPCVLTAQTPASIQRAVNSITPGDVRQRISVLADDSMLGRATPSPQLEQAASYIAAEFRRFGLKPGGDAGSPHQRYTVVQRAVDTAASGIRIAGPASATLKPGADVYLYGLGPLPAGEVTGPVVLFIGTPDSANPLGGVDVRGSWVAMVATATPQGVSVNLGWFATALRAGAVGLVVISDRPDAQWQNRLARTLLPTRSVEGVPADSGAVAPAFEIRDRTAAALLGIDPAAARAQTTGWSARRLAGATIAFRVKERELARASAPNVIGILEGSDPKLKHEYVFFTAHMDHVGTPGAGQGCTARGADSICNGADDDASGTTAVIEAAEAFSKLSPRPKRSLVFMTVSGEERGLWGSAYFSEHPTVPLANVVANLNADMVGRNWSDTIAVIGKEHSDLGATLDRVAAAHPELRMTPIDDIWPEQRFYFRSDHYNFARSGVPILFFFNGTHPDYHEVSDSPDKIDADKASRVVKLVFYVGLEVANAAQRPKWNPDSYRQIVQTAP
ncbi:MAG TPA: M20/M25/M40 family metallo-hydrolase [Gemmatimonadales bacterium]|nr:M20/M25/M40 family metallo-hydrolase [Gemmatimonadales bacterium]